MPGPLRLFKVLVALTALVAAAGCTAVAEQPVEPKTVEPVSGQWLGSGGCAAMGCHNANGKKGERGSEYTTWVFHDRHARAYEVLFNTKSRAIVKNLKLESGKLPNEFPLCLNCHVHKSYELANHQPRFAKEDGVGCESCHGPASGWVSEHYKLGWAARSTTEKAAKGMWDTRGLVGRVRGCTACHVGAPGMDVNHDLIAAGHPRLAFDFSAYHALIPHHWQDAKDKQARPDSFALAAWFVGEAITTQAALELLASRAGSNIWPELAEYDCYACHHQLQNQSWRQKRGFAGRKPGNLPWNDWYVSPLPYRVHPGSARANAADDLAKQVATLKQVMEKTIAPDPKDVHRQAIAAAKELEAWVKQFDDARYPLKDVAGILQQLAERGATKKAGSWDEAAKTYLAVVAICQVLPPDAKVKEALTAIRRLLQFDQDSNSPPAMYTPERLLDPYQLLQKRLGS